MSYSKILKPIKSILIISIVATLFGCINNKVDPFDLQTGFSRKEIENSVFANKNKEDSKNKIPSFISIPKSSNMIILPSRQKTSNQQLISFSITDKVPLKDVLIELSKSAKLDLNLDPSIEGGVIINAFNRPLNEVLDRICVMGKLRYSLIDNILHIEKDTPFSKNYSVDFLIDGKLWEEFESNAQALISESNGGEGGSISTSKLSNMMTIFASEKGHKKIAEYLKKIKKSSSAQVLIEAKVVEVTLNNEYTTGIDWSWASNDEVSRVSSSNNGAGAGDALKIILGGNNLFGKSLSSSISALEKFGSVRAISSPRISALNNQEAKLDFTEKLVYFTNDIATETTTSAENALSQATLSSTMHTENTGTELTIIPVIDLVTNEITLNVKPKITISNNTVTQTFPNPYGGSPIENKIPLINTRELSTVAKIKSGSVLVIGGLMSEKGDNTDTGIPFLNKIPILGYLFKSVSKNTSINETVIFVKATIVKIGDGADQHDRDLENKFSSSKRQFFDK
jgi:general secretion pathway protein D